MVELHPLMAHREIMIWDSGQIMRNSAELEVITTILPFIMTTMNAAYPTGEIITE
jgi:hypothetical protein